jgi:hypothetical protein
VSIEAISGDPEIMIRVSESDHRNLEKAIDSSKNSSNEILYSPAQWLDIIKRCEHATPEANRLRDQNVFNYRQVFGLPSGSLSTVSQPSCCLLSCCDQLLASEWTNLSTDLHCAPYIPLDRRDTSIILVFWL